MSFMTLGWRSIRLRPLSVIRIFVLKKAFLADLLDFVVVPPTLDDRTL